MSNYEKKRDKSADFNQPPQQKIFQKQTHHTHGVMSEDINFGRHAKNPIFADKETLEKIMTAFMDLLRNHTNGIKSTEINKLMSEKLGFPFSHVDLNCNSELEFIKKFILPRTEIDILTSCAFENEQYFTIRAKKLYNTGFGDSQQ